MNSLRSFLSLIALLLASLAALQAAETRPTRPTILVFLTDDQSQLDAAPDGEPVIRTPNMRRLADAGMTLERAYVASPSCAPSRAALLTGLMPARNGAEANHSKPRAGITKWPAYFQELGYEVVAFGKVSHYKHTGDYGFDHFADDGFHQDQCIATAVEWLKNRPKLRPSCKSCAGSWTHGSINKATHCRSSRSLASSPIPRATAQTPQVLPPIHPSRNRQGPHPPVNTRRRVRARDANWLPGRLFHSRMAPITRFAVRGAIWYQGESNCGDGEDPRDYQHKLRALIVGWRRALRNEQLPVYFVQLPGSGAREGWPYLREQQRLATDLPRTGMVVTVDIDGEGIHPPNKFDVGQRLALWALANDYDRPVAFSGPLFNRLEIHGNKLVVHFQHAEGGLMVATKDGVAAPRETPDAELALFELVDTTGAWQPAKAVIDGQTIVVTSAQVPTPVAVRHAYGITPMNCNLYNRDGLPAAPFCSDPDLLVYDPRLPK